MAIRTQLQELISIHYLQAQVALVRQGRGDISGDLVVVLNFTAELRAAMKGGRP